MKFIFYNFLFATQLLILFGCNSSSIDDKSKRNEHWTWFVDSVTGKGEWSYIDNRTTVNSGRFTQFHSNGSIRVEGKLIHGQVRDTVYYFDLNSQLYCYSIFGEDTVTWYVHDGPLKIFSATCKLEQEGIIENHAVGDRWTKYFDNGNINKTWSLVNDTGWVISFYENGKLKDSILVTGPNTSVFKKQCYENGNVAYTAELKNGKENGVCAHYYENGRFKKITICKDGIANGIVKDYYENGQIKDSVFAVNDMAEGIGYNWYETGAIKIIGEYKDGYLNGKSIVNYPSGKIHYELTAVNDLPDGEVLEYNERGKLFRKIYWRDRHPIDTIQVSQN